MKKSLWGAVFGSSLIHLAFMSGMPGIFFNAYDTKEKPKAPIIVHAVFEESVSGAENIPESDRAHPPDALSLKKGLSLKKVISLKKVSQESMLLAKLTSIEAHPYRLEHHNPLKPLPKELVSLKKAVSLKRPESRIERIDRIDRIEKSPDLLTMGLKIRSVNEALYKIYLRYYKHVRGRIAGEVKYPISARDFGFSGSVHIEFVINPDGKLVWIGLLSPSSYEVLNLAAIQTIRRASPFEVYPDEIPKKNFRFTIPIIYEMD